MQNILILVILLAIFSAAIAYIVRQKKKGVKCVGCECAETCEGSHTKR